MKSDKNSSTTWKLPVSIRRLKRKVVERMGAPVAASIEEDSPMDAHGI